MGNLIFFFLIFPFTFHRFCIDNEAEIGEPFTDLIPILGCESLQLGSLIVQVHALCVYEVCVFYRARNLNNVC